MLMKIMTCVIVFAAVPLVLIVPRGDSLDSEDVSVPEGATDLKIGLALGAGGANGLAHIRILEAFDELGLVPHRIAGSSMGALMGALYASGSSAAEIREMLDEIIVQKSDSWRELFLDGKIFRWVDLVDLDIGEGGLLASDAVMARLQETIEVETFEELKVPLYVVAADLWEREEVVFSSGEILPAVKASMAVPGLFAPEIIDGRVLVDGGTVNPVPYDLLFDECDVVVAVNVIGFRTPRDELSFLKAMFTGIQVMQAAILREKMNQMDPDIFIETRTEDVRMLEFGKFGEIYEKALPAKESLMTQLRERLTTPE